MLRLRCPLRVEEKQLQPVGRMQGAEQFHLREVRRASQTAVLLDVSLDIISSSAVSARLESSRPGPFSFFMRYDACTSPMNRTTHAECNPTPYSEASETQHGYARNWKSTLERILPARRARSENTSHARGPCLAFAFVYRLPDLWLPQ